MANCPDLARTRAFTRWLSATSASTQNSSALATRIFLGIEVQILETHNARAFFPSHSYGLNGGVSGGHGGNRSHVMSEAGATYLITIRTSAPTPRGVDNQVNLTFLYEIDYRPYLICSYPALQQFQSLRVLEDHLWLYTIAHQDRVRPPRRPQPETHLREQVGNSDLSLIHISEPTRLRRISYAVFCLKKK